MMSDRPMDSTLKNYSLPLALVLITAFFGLSFLEIGNYPIWNKDEGLYAETVREMFLNHNFFDPYFNYEHRWQKPILIYWVLAASSYVFGVNEFGIRFGLGAMGVVSAAIIFLLSYRMFRNFKISVFAVLFFVSSFAYVLQTRHIATHMLLLMTTMLSFWILWEMVKNGSGKIKAFVFGVSLGLGFLAKGPVGPVLVLVVGVLFGFRKIIASPKQSLKLTGIGLIAFLLVALPWYGYMLYAYGGEYIAFLRHEIFDRVGTNITPNSSPFFYLGAFAGNFSPWSLLFYFVLTLSLFRVFRHKEETFSLPVLFTLAGFFTVIILFSLSASKLPAYVFPAQPFAAIFLAYFLFTVERGFWVKGVIFVTKLIYVVAIFALPYLYFDKYWLALSVILAAVTLFLARGRYELSKIGILALAGYMMIVVNIFDEVKEFFPYKRFGEKVVALNAKSSFPLYEYNFFRESVPFYAQTKERKFDPANPPKEPFILMLDSKNADVIKDGSYLYAVLDKSRYYKGSDSNVYKMINILKGYKPENDDIGEVLLLKVTPFSGEGGISF